MGSTRKIIILSLLFFIPFHIAFADDNLDRQKKALDMISRFANDICGGHQDSGETTSTEFSGQISADIKGLLKKLAGLGISGTAAFENKSYQGVLQKDLAELLKDKMKCRSMVMMEFKSLVLMEDTSSTPSKKHTITGQWNSLFGPVTFTQVGNEVNGTLYYSAEQLKKLGATANIKGELADKTLTFVWWVFGDTPNNPTGKGVLTLSEDGNLLKGHFTDRNSPGSSSIWQLTRK
jgi:hypothetical protein